MVRPGYKSVTKCSRHAGSVPWTLPLAWIAALSALGFALAAWDKARARRGGRRVPEATLLLVALAGGSPGLLAAMLLVRHKTRKASFLAALAVVLLAQGLALWWLLRL